MDIRNWFKPEVWRLNARLWMLISATFAAVLIGITTPWLSLAAVGALIAAVSHAARNDRLALPFAPLPSWVIAAGIGIAYIMLSVLWSADPRTTALTGLVVTALALSVHCLARWFNDCPSDWLEHMTRTLLVAVVAALLFLLVEELSSHAVKRMLFWPFHALRWHDGAPSFNASEARVYIPPQRVKWNMPPLNFLLWPALLIASLHLGNRAARWSQLVIAAAAIWVILLSDHKTSLAAIIAAVVIFIAAHWDATRMRQLLIVLWTLGFVVVIPLAFAGFEAGLHLDKRVGPTLQARVILWNHTAGQIANQPLLGVGAAATRRLDRRNLPAAEAAQPKNFVYAPRTGPHAHNIFLQSWYELGAIGSAIFFSFGLLVLRGIAMAPKPTQPYMLATATTVIVTGTSSFGLFEIWFMATFAMCAIASAMATAYQKRVAG